DHRRLRRSNEWRGQRNRSGAARRGAQRAVGAAGGAAAGARAGVLRRIVAIGDRGAASRTAGNGEDQNAARHEEAAGTAAGISMTHEEYEAIAALDALGAATPDEALSLAAHADACDDCRRAREQYAEAATLLAQGLDPVSP